MMKTIFLIAFLFLGMQAFTDKDTQENKTAPPKEPVRIEQQDKQDKQDEDPFHIFCKTTYGCLRESSAGYSLSVPEGSRFLYPCHAGAVGTGSGNASV